MDHWEDWQKVYQHGTLVIWPPDDLRMLVNRQREENDPKSAAICETHITLTQPLLHPLNEKQWAVIHNITVDLKPFDIAYGPIKSFLPYPCILYEIQPADRVLEIREALHKTGFFDLSLAHTDGFIPHMTITEGMSGPEVDEKLLLTLQDQSTSGSFLCSRITFIKPNEDFLFRVQLHIPLG